MATAIITLPEINAANPQNSKRWRTPYHEEFHSPARNNPEANTSTAPGRDLKTRNPGGTHGKDMSR